MLIQQIFHISRYCLSKSSGPTLTNHTIFFQPQIKTNSIEYLKGRNFRVYKFSRKQNFARINFRDWRFQLFRGNLFSRISRMKKFLCISRGEIFANFASRRFFKLWRKLIFELRPSHIRPRRGHISFWSSYHTITSSECTYHQWPPILGITFNNI